MKGFLRPSIPVFEQVSVGSPWLGFELVVAGKAARVLSRKLGSKLGDFFLLSFNKRCRSVKFVGHICPKVVVSELAVLYFAIT